MKIILVAPTPPPAGGIASWTKRMLETDLLKEWEIEVVDTKIIGNRNVFAKEKKSFKVELKRLFSIWKDLWGKASFDDVKVVHSCIPAGKNSMIREIICMMIAKMKKKKFIIHYRCTVPNMVNDKFSLFLFNILNKKSDCILVLNKESEEFVNIKYRHKVKLIPNFIETKSLHEGEKIINRRITKIVYVGGVTIEKGCEEILEVAKKYPEKEFRLIGSVNEKISSLEKSPNVIFLGEKSKDFIKKELANADLFLFLSYFYGEGFSNSLVEAMAMGIPCVVTDWAANKDMIEDKGGIVLPIKTPDKLFEAIKNLDLDIQTRQKMSRWNLKKVKNEYIDKVVIRQYVDVYNEVIEQ
ncbi:glycosyltransferase family 4 protein [Vagococcus fluvialis]|uniref:glycosyltransferase family 4 protein n=1 Tax=Vagococcus fluvialis TaxID=2738 RepID=UPI0037D3F9C4